MQAGIPPQITSTDVANILSTLDSEMNRVILAAHLQGMYSGVLAVALWTIFTQKSRPVGKVTVVVLIIVYIMEFATFSLDWSTARLALVVNGQNVLTKITWFEKFQRAAVTLATSTMGAISTILADSVMIWRCWLVWGQRWQIVLLPSVCLVAGIVCKILVVRQRYIDGADGFTLSSAYASLTLATTLSCTLLIIYRILAIALATDRGRSRSSYRRIIEVFTESSALYVVSLILYVAFFARGDVATSYLDPIAGFTRGIAPTLLLGRVAAGHARPDDSWQGSVMTSPLRFGQDKTGKSPEDDSMMASRGFEDDLEARPEACREAEHTRVDLQEEEDAGQCGGRAEDPSGLAEDDPEAISIKPNH